MKERDWNRIAKDIVILLFGILLGIWVQTGYLLVTGLL